MSTGKVGPPKHQNKFAWKPKLGVKINETEPGGRFRPLSEITGVCPRCKVQIEWKRKYGKYKPLKEPAKCQKCSKRAVRQAHHNLCAACVKEHKVCAKCSCRVAQLVGKDISDVEAEKKELEEAIKNARERDRRSLLRAMNKANKSDDPTKMPSNDEKKAGDLFEALTLEEYAKATNGTKDDDSDDNEDSENGSNEGDDDSNDEESDSVKDEDHENDAEVDEQKKENDDEVTDEVLH